VDAAADSPPPLPLGQLLASERERQGLSRADAAQRLHMSAWQVEALENGDWSRLPKGTFLRGFVRNYTRLLGLNPDAALHALSQAAPSIPAPGIVVPSHNIRFEPIGERLSSPYVKAWGVAGVAIALGFAAMYWWLFIRPAPPAASLARKESVASPVVPQNIALAPVPPPEPVVPREAPKEEVPAKAEAVRPATTDSLKPNVSKQEAVKAQPAPEARPKKPVDVVAPPVATPAAAVPETRVTAGERTLRLRFKGTSWVEIKDRSGKVLLAKVNEPGSETEVSGRPPFSVVVGNAPDVTLLYDDREFPLEPHTRVAVARFTLE
jgi:cytoskeleton protein RodZ